MAAKRKQWIGSLLLMALAVGCEQTPVGLPEATTLVVGPDQLQLVAGDMAAASAQVLDQNGRLLKNAEVSWSSSSPSIGTVTPDGLVAAVAPGSTRLIARHGSLTGELQVTVVRDDRDFITELELSRADIAMDRRAGVQVVGFRAFDGRGRSRCDAALEFSVTDRSVANVSQAAGCRILITPLGPGRTTITAVAGGAAASLAVDVTLGGHVAFFAERPDDEELRAGNVVTYRVRLVDADNQPVANHVVNFDATVGSLAVTSTATDANGTAVVEWRLPRVLRQRDWMGTAYEFGQLIFRTQLPDGRVEAGADHRQVTAGPASTLAFLTTNWAAGSQAPLRRIAETLTAPLNTTVAILVESRDEHGNRRDIDGITLSADQIQFNQWFWAGDVYYKAVLRYEMSPRTMRVTATDGAVTADLDVTFTAGS